MKQSLEFSKEQRFHNASIHTSRSTTAQGEMLQEVASGRPGTDGELVKIPTHDTEDARPTASLGGAAWQTR